MKRIMCIVSLLLIVACEKEDVNPPKEKYEVEFQMAIVQLWQESSGLLDPNNVDLTITLNLHFFGNKMQASSNENLKTIDIPIDSLKIVGKIPCEGFNEYENPVGYSIKVIPGWYTFDYSLKISVEGQTQNIREYLRSCEGKIIKIEDNSTFLFFDHTE
jgi:Tfp pilus assembly protein PilP